MPRDARTLDLALDRPSASPAVLRVTGEVDLPARTVIAAAVRPLVARGEPVVVDLSQVTFADSSLAHLLVDLAQQASDCGWEYAVGEVSEAASRVFSLCGIDAVVPRYAPA